jgi:peptidoglycan/LPS O-acetylase OafA/YrhL
MTERNSAADATRGAHRLPVLDGVRALSIGMVLAGHLFPLGPSQLGLNGAVAALGMALFFCLSGFLIASFLDARPDVAEFAVRRVFRIVPGLALFLAVAAAVGSGVTWKSALINLGFFANYDYAGLGPGPIGHLWSLSVEMQFYGAISLVVLILGRRGLWVLPVAAVGVTLLRIQAGALININTHLRVDEILTGGTLALIVRRLGPVRISPGPGAAVGVVCLGVVWALSGYEPAGAVNYARPYLTAGLVGAVLIGPLPTLQRVLSAKALRYVADISYALYLYHPLMVTGVLAGHGTVGAYLIKRPISVLLTWGAAHLSTFGWERRWNDLARGPVFAWLRAWGRVSSSAR